MDFLAGTTTAALLRAFAPVECADDFVVDVGDRWPQHSEDHDDDYRHEDQDQGVFDQALPASAAALAGDLIALLFYRYFGNFSHNEYSFD
jgi:hypothetical protein